MGDVVFRKVHGRIIPIRKGGESRQVSAGKAAGAAVAGVAIGAKSGAIAADATHTAAKFINRAEDAVASLGRSVSRASRKLATVPAEQASLGFMGAGQRLRFKPRTDIVMAHSERLKAAAEVVHKNRFIIRSAGAAAAGGLLAYATLKGIQAATGKEPSKTTTAEAFRAAAITGAAIVGAAYYNRLGGAGAAVRHVVSVVKKFK